MGAIDFVFVDGIAVGLLVADDGQRRFCGATQALLDVEGLVFCDLLEAQDFITERLRRRPAFDGADSA
jgi:hypothetical protein